MVRFGFLLIYFTLNTLIQAQSSNKKEFLEANFSLSKFIESELLGHTYFAKIMEPDSMGNGLIPSNNGKNILFNLTYRRSVTACMSLSTFVRYARHYERAYYSCNNCDNLIIHETIAIIPSFATGIGLNYKLKQFSKINFSFQSNAIYSIMLHDMNRNFFGFNIAPVVSYLPTNTSYYYNLKVGFEKTFQPYSKEELYGELGIAFNLK